MQHSSFFTVSTNRLRKARTIQISSLQNDNVTRSKGPKNQQAPCYHNESLYDEK